MKSQLFRQETLNSCRVDMFGSIILTRPVTFTFLAVFALLLVALVGILLYWGSYTKRSTVGGQLVFDTATQRIFVPDTGFVTKVLVTAEQWVNEGQEIAEINLATRALQNSDTTAAPLVIRANMAGMVATVEVENGQPVEKGQVIATIVPGSAKLQAQLYVPSDAIGFVKEGDPILLRYQTFPYEKFGHAKGHVRSVSRLAVVLPDGGGPANGRRGSFFRVSVSLPTQQVQADGYVYKLQPGIGVNAEVRRERRRLYQWVFSPLNNLARQVDM